MKIAMIGHKRIPGREGGVEVVVEELSTRLIQKGNIVEAYNRRKKGLHLPTEYKGVKLIEVPTIETKNTDAVIYSLIASIKVLFGHYDVIHYHAIGPAFFLIIPHLFGIKTVVTVHGLNYMTPKWSGLGAAFIKTGEKITAKYADKIIVLSQRQQTYFKEKYKRNTVFISNGITLQNIVEPGSTLKENGLEKNKYILVVSRVVPGKGLEYLLDAYRQIKCDLPLVIAGDSAYVDDFYKQIQMLANKDSRVRLLGFVEGKKLQELYSNAALFVFPSEAEGMAMCLLEALSYNCKCLVSNIPENTEIGKDYVQVFESCNTNDLKEKLEQCIKHRDKIFINKSREYIQDNFEWDSIIDRTIRCYEE